MYGKPYTNIHHLLNDFDRAFGHRRLETHVRFVEGPFVYVTATYARDVLITDENKWGSHMPFLVGAKWDQCLMLKLRIKEEQRQRKDWLVTQMETKYEYHPILYRDDIYMNSYTMSDKNLAADFRNAIQTFDIGSRAYEIKLDGKLLEQARRKTNKALSKDRDALASMLKEQIEKEYYLEGNTPLQKIESLRYRIDGELAVYKYLNFVIDKETDETN